MQSVLVIQHIECETLGLFESESANGLSYSYLRPYGCDPVPDSVAAWDAIMILGGPMAVYEREDHPYLDREIELIRQAIKAGKPMIGICLGAQLIAAAAGSRVYPGPVREVGWSQVTLNDYATTDDLFSGLPSPLLVFQLHGDSFELPEGAILLAGNESYANQAFRLGTNVYGLQFHVEATGTLVGEWAGEYADYIAAAGVTRAELLGDIDDRCAALKKAAAHITRRFASLVRREDNDNG